MKSVLVTYGKYWAKVDDEDYDKAASLSWGLQSGKYAFNSVKGLLMHTLIMQH